MARLMADGKLEVAAEAPETEAALATVADRPVSATFLVLPGSTEVATDRSR